MSDKLKLGDDKLFVVRFDYMISHYQLHIDDDIKKVQEMFSGPKIHIEQVIPISKLKELIISFEYVLECGASIGLSDIISDIQKLIDESKNETNS